MAALRLSNPGPDLLGTPRKTSQPCRLVPNELKVYPAFARDIKLDGPRQHLSGTQPHDTPSWASVLDGDTDVDREDFRLFEACWSGPGVPQNDPACEKARLDQDSDVDQSDFGIWQRCYSGENNPAEPNCGA